MTETEYQITMRKVKYLIEFGLHETVRLSTDCYVSKRFYHPDNQPYHIIYKYKEIDQSWKANVVYSYNR